MGKDKESARAKWPKTLDEAVDRLLVELPKKDKKAFKETKENNLIMLHHGFGTDIRNVFGLWEGNEELLKSCGGEWIHPDSASMVIIETAWKRLQQE